MPTAEEKRVKRQKKAAEKDARKAQAEKDGPPPDYMKMRGNKAPKPNKSFVTYYQDIVPKEQWEVRAAYSVFIRDRT